MNKHYLLLPIFNFSREKICCQFFTNKGWGNKDQCVGDSPPHQSWLSPALLLVLSSSHECPWSGQGSQGTDIEKFLLRDCTRHFMASSLSEGNVLNRLMEPSPTVVELAQKTQMQFFRFVR